MHVATCSVYGKMRGTPMAATATHSCVTLDPGNIEGHADGSGKESCVNSASTKHYRINLACKWQQCLKPPVTSQIQATRPSRRSWRGPRRSARRANPPSRRPSGCGSSQLPSLKNNSGCMGDGLSTESRLQQLGQCLGVLRVSDLLHHMAPRASACAARCACALVRRACHKAQPVQARDCASHPWAKRVSR